MPLADTLLRLAGGPRLFLPKWTDQIMAEITRNLQENFGVTAEQAAYREGEIRKHFGEAWVEGYEEPRERSAMSLPPQFAPVRKQS